MGLSMNRNMSFETFEHGADIGVRGYGKTLEEAFKNCAKAMFSIMVDDLKGIEPVEQVEIQCSSIDLTGLLVAYLNTLIAEADIRNLIFKDFECSINQSSNELMGRASGGRFPAGQEALGIEVKGATFTLSKVEKDGNLYVAQCVVDV